jgi:hypothetical protein
VYQGKLRSCICAHRCSCHPDTARCQLPSYDSSKQSLYCMAAACQPMAAALALPAKMLVEVTFAAAPGEPPSGSTVVVVKDTLRLLLNRAGAVTLQQQPQQQAMPCVHPDCGNPWHINR